jgi:hypothetical protein
MKSETAYTTAAGVSLRAHQLPTPFEMCGWLVRTRSGRLVRARLNRKSLIHSE